MTRSRFFNDHKEDTIELRICFTADSIFYLKALQLPINLNDWIWHEEQVNGNTNLIITDKRSTLDITEPKK